MCFAWKLAASVRGFNVEERQIPVECDITGICEEAPRDQQDAVNQIIQDFQASVQSLDIEGWQIPVECDITGICEEAPRDQQDVVNKIIQDLLKNNTTLQSDELVPNNSPRLNPVEDNIELCVSREKFQVLVRSSDIKGESGRFRRQEDSLDIPDECKEIGICEQAPKDQEDAVNKIIEDLLSKNQHFTSDVLPPTASRRKGADEDNMELCDSTVRLHAPQMVRDNNDNWHRVLNTNQNPVQKFRVEICSKSDESCSGIMTLQSGYSSRCVQKYVMREMETVNDKNEVVKASLPLPSCCSCVARVM
ncbi:uncharacterized protein [Epargyreus clarus]|uniref:uncharacterized protein n=1 Tax=Epargyreus clarus TaxID=520877 RepID=UPI003C2D0E38